MLKFDQFVRSEAHTDFVSRLLKYQPVVDRPVSERPFSVLEIGCGAGADIKGLREALLTSGLPPPSLRFVATDRAFPGTAERLAALRNETEGGIETRIYTVGAEQQETPFEEDEKFDLVFARLSLHYFDEELLEGQVLPYIKGLLNGGAVSSGSRGALVVTVKTAENIAPEDQKYQKVFISGEEWRALLRRVGFRVLVGEPDKSGAAGGAEKNWVEAGAPWTFEAVVVDEDAEDAVGTGSL